MPGESIYLDHNATSPLLPEAADAICDAWADGFANPASQHEPGRRARRRLESARQRIIGLLGGQADGVDPDRLVFTSGGTEANDLAIRGLLAASGRPGLVISAIEHPSVARTADDLESEGRPVDRLSVSSDGFVELAQLEALLAERGDVIGLVSVMTASNETGVLQPVAAIAELCRAAGVAMHTDAVQAVGKLPIRFRESGFTAMSLAAHKFHGPLGVGAVMLAPGVSIRPRLHGGFQQESLRPGTESAPLAVGLLAALEAANEEGSERSSRLGRLRDRLEEGLVGSWPGAVVLGRKSERAPHATCVAFPGADRQALVMAYDLAGVACSTGSACASGSSEPSPTLVAMGLSHEVVNGAVRFAVGALTTEAEVDEAVRRVRAVNERLGGVASAPV